MVTDHYKLITPDLKKMQNGLAIPMAQSKAILYCIVFIIQLYNQFNYQRILDGYFK